jgi:phosphoribosylformylglycinamidine synthase I
MVMIEQAPRAIIIKARGTNCDAETKEAFNLAGADAEIIPISQIRLGVVRIIDYQIVIFPGGFSSGDHLGSGEVTAADIVLHKPVADQLLEHALNKKKPVVGICNGFQKLVRIGLIPYTEVTTLDKVKTALAPNASGHFEYRWVNLLPDTNKINSKSLFKLPDEVMTLPVAHGEGRFYADENTINEIVNQGYVVFRYCDKSGKPTQHYPENPNGSLSAIAGICNREGNVMALMPHPERYVRQDQHPNYRSTSSDFVPDGLKIIQSIVNYAKQM